jgi:hypothetical protein
LNQIHQSLQRSNLSNIQRRGKRVKSTQLHEDKKSDRYRHSVKYSYIKA